MDQRVKEALKYGIAFVLLITVFFGGSYVLKGVLGTEYPMMVVVSQSMVPTLGVGDYIIVAKVPDVKQIPVGTNTDGEIIVFLKPGGTDEYIVHRAIKRIDSGGSVSYVTKGDNNAFADGSPVPSGNVMGKVVGNIPIIGYFSLFIKTLRGFGLVVAFMAIIFLLDYILPQKRPNVGHFNVLALVPTLVAPAVVVSFWFISSNAAHLSLDMVAISTWYISCLILPLAFHDDDSASMIWLYDIVLIMLPIACDVTWWTLGITPSNWWPVLGGTVSVNWFLLPEMPSFGVVFDSVLKTLLPGVVIFIVTLFAKRRGWEPFDSWQRRLRGAPKVTPMTETSATTVPDQAASSRGEPSPAPRYESATENA